MERCGMNAYNTHTHRQPTYDHGLSQVQWTISSTQIK